MQAKFEMTDGWRNLRAILENFPDGSAHWNEAQNRFQFVDRLLMECLGWSHPYIRVEERDDAGGYADYLLGEPIKAALEAKREAIKFDLLPAQGASVVHKLRPLVSGCKVLEKAVLQVLSYCTLHGAPIAIVCNGPQMVVFQSYIAGQSPLDSDSFVFNGFEILFEVFTPASNLLVEMQRLGFNLDQTRSALRRLAERRLIENSARSLPRDSGDGRFVA